MELIHLRTRCPTLIWSVTEGSCQKNALLLPLAAQLKGETASTTLPARECKSRARLEAEYREHLAKILAARGLRRQLGPQT